MAAMTMDQREPEVAKFIDTYKYDQEMSSRRNKFGGGTSLPLNSDGYEDKQRALRDERHRDWMVQQEKKYAPYFGTTRPHHRPVSHGPQSPADYDDQINRITGYNEPSEPVYYRVGTPEQGFPGLGSYSKQRQENNVARQKEYNALLRKQRQMEQQKMEERHRSPPRPAQPQGPQMDYNLASEQARAEERRSYQNHMGKYQYAANAAPKPTFDYEENKKILNEERKREYNQLMEKKAQEERYVQMHGRPVTPPGGLNIGAYDRQMKETAEEKKRQYKEMLDQQHNEQQKLRALDRVADVSPKYVSYRENERPLVGSPRDVNYYMQEKLEKDKFRRDLRRSPQRDNSPPSKYYNSEQNSHKTDDPNLKAYIEVEREKALSKKKYAEELLQQQKEHMYLRARQEPEMAVIDRNALSQHPTNKPPPGPGYNRPRDEPMRQNPSYWNEGRKARGPRSFDSDVSRRSSGIPGETIQGIHKSRPGSELQYKRVPRKRRIEKITEESLDKHVSDRRLSSSYSQEPTDGYQPERLEVSERDVRNDFQPNTAMSHKETRKHRRPRSIQSSMTDSSYNGHVMDYKKRTKLQTILESPRRKQKGRRHNDEDNDEDGSSDGDEEDNDQTVDTHSPEWLRESPENDKKVPDRLPQLPEAQTKAQKKQQKNVPSKKQKDKQSEGYVMEYKNDTKSHPARDRYNHQPHPDNGYSKPEVNGISERRSPVGSPPRSPLKSPLKSPQRLPPMSPLKSPPKSPAKRYNTDRRRDSDARQALEGTPLAFKTDSRRVFERPQHGQPPYPGHSQYMPDREKLNPETVERPPPPRSPYKPSDPEWLKPSEEDRPVEGTPLAFKTNTYSRPPPPAPEHSYNDPPGFSHDGRRPGDSDGYYERSGRPRSRRPTEDENKYVPSYGDTGSKISPRRMKQSLYEDSVEVSTKRREASKERQKEYNDYLRLKTEQQQRRRNEERHQQQISKPAEVVKNQYYSSDDYEKFQKEIQRKQSEEYRDFLAKKFQPPPGRIGLPLGQYKYEPKRLGMEAERNMEYNNLLKEQYQPTNAAQGLPIGQYRYEPKRLAMEKERNKEYNELLKQKSNNNTPRSIDGPQGLSIDVTFERRKKAFLEQQRNKEYNDFLKKEKEKKGLTQSKESNRRSHSVPLFHFPPPSPLPKHKENMKIDDEEIMNNNFTKNVVNSHKTKDLLNTQPDYHYKKENLSSEQNSSGVGIHRPPRNMWPKENTFHQQVALHSPNVSFVGQGSHSAPATPINSLPIGQYDDKRAFLVKRRNKDYNKIKEKLPANKNKGITPEATSLTLPVGQYDLIRPEFERQRNNEYNQLIRTGRIGKNTLREKVATPPEKQGLPIGQQNYEPLYKAMEHQRNREYNEFLMQKYGKSSRSTRSEPNRSRTSFYTGNDGFHEEKRKMLDDERKTEYRKYVQELEPARSRSIDIPSDVDSGLPIGQQHHEAWKKFLREQRNQEYNQLVDMKAGETRNREWNFDQAGVLELHGDDAVQSRQRELRAERQKEYNSYISQMKNPPNHYWPEPDGRGALLVRKGEYDSVRQMYDNQRKQEFVDTLQKRREQGLDMPPSTAPPEPLRKSYELNNPMVQVLGRYEDFRQKLRDDRKKDFKSFMDKVKADETSRHLLVSTAPNLAREETPLIHSMGVYEKETKKKVSQQRKKDFQEFAHEKKMNWTPRTMVKENLMPHVASAETPLVNYMGSYDKEQVKFRLEANKDLRAYSEKRKKELRNPYDNYVYPTVAVAEKPIVAYMGSEVEKRKINLRQERKQDYEHYKAQQKVKNPERRHEFVDTASGPFGGLFQGLGEHGNRSEMLNKERQREYNEHNAGKEKVSGRPNWARETLPNDTDRGRGSPMKTQPPPDQYEQMLDEKRREEASRRRYDDPEYRGRLVDSRERERDGGQRFSNY